MNLEFNIISTQDQGLSVNMDTHEYQAKIILRKYGIPVPEFAIISDLDEAVAAVDEMNLEQAVIKVQVHAGGRGKVGGVKIAKSRDEIFKTVEEMLGMRVVTKQTGSRGIVAHQLLLSPRVDIEKEYYIGAVVDREKAQATLIVSPDGGMEIEEVAEKDPDRIATIPLRRDGTLRDYQLLYICKLMGWSGSVAEQGKEIVQTLAKVFIDTDASLLEINPLVLTKDGRLLALDAKLSADDNALFRQPLIKGFYDPTQIPHNEAQAKKYDLAYIQLDGNIGCMVNGAGLAMATMDIIKHYGGTPANFLDVGGGATPEKVAEGFKILLADPKVQAILVNIFGGIMNCVTIAAGIIAAVSELAIKVPLVVRMEGTNVEKGRKMLEDSGLNIIIADGLDNAAREVVKSIQRAEVS